MDMWWRWGGGGALKQNSVFFNNSFFVAGSLEGHSFFYVIVLFILHLLPAIFIYSLRHFYLCLLLLPQFNVKSQLNESLPTTVCKGKSKVHPRTGNEVPEGE
jgi:hypothetical protein